MNLSSNNILRLREADGSIEPGASKSWQQNALGRMLCWVLQVRETDNLRKQGVWPQHLTLKDITVDSRKFSLVVSLYIEQCKTDLFC